MQKKQQKQDESGLERRRRLLKRSLFFARDKRCTEDVCQHMNPTGRSFRSTGAAAKATRGRRGRRLAATYLDCGIHGYACERTETKRLQSPARMCLPAPPSTCGHLSEGHYKWRGQKGLARKETSEEERRERSTAGGGERGITA